jgi:uncharacterized membrane protein YsdA (DUF1294 family)
MAFHFYKRGCSKMGLWTWLIVLFINVYSLCLMGFDKKQARKGGFRISERALWIAAICGGAIGAVIGMNLFRHKTKHRSFQIGMPLLAVLQLVLLSFYLK